MLDKTSQARKNYLPFKRVLKKITNRLVGYYKLYFLRDEFAQTLHRWFKDKGDKTLRLNYNLSKNSIVFDVGGYKGDFAYEINNKYQCHVYLFEPSLEFYNHCVKRFKTNPKIHCFNFGLSDEDGDFYLTKNDDASSIFDEKQMAIVEKEAIKLRSFSNVFSELNINSIDLLKVNIEGGEFNLLPHLIDTLLIEKIVNAQIQFHNFVKDAELKRNKIRNCLSRTHENDWCYKFVWENWRLKNSSF